MTHLPFVAGAYGATIAMYGALFLSATLRLRSARRRVRALERRRGQTGGRTLR